MLVERELFPSRSRAAAAVMTGKVRVNGRKVEKPGARFDADCRIETAAEDTYVSRGGRKLAAALKFFKVDPSGKVVLDGGASTGGFTDCLLRAGARKVIAVDVGYGQFAWRLRQDPRVELLERRNLRYLRLEDISEPAWLATVDVSFISLKKIVPAVNRCLTAAGKMLLLVKPQFEAGREAVGKGGIVREAAQHQLVLEDIAAWLADFGLNVMGVGPSPLRGAKGNIEFWIYAGKMRVGHSQTARLDAELIAEAVKTAHRGAAE